LIFRISKAESNTTGNAFTFASNFGSSAAGRMRLVIKATQSANQNFIDIDETVPFFHCQSKANVIQIVSFRAIRA
jgi:hypothetical protein